VFFQDNIKNMFLILLIIIVFSGVGFYSASVIQDEKIAKLAGEKDATINSLNSEVTYLRNIFGDLVMEYEELEKEMGSYESEYMQKSMEYVDLSEKYAQLEENYTSSLQEYAVLNSSYALEMEAFINRTRVGEGKVRMFFNDVSVECPQDVLVSVHTHIDTNLINILTGYSFTEKTVISIGWIHAAEEPDLYTTLRAAYESVKKYVDAASFNKTMMKDDYMIRYINFTATVYGEMRYALVSTWYDIGASRQYMCIVLQWESDTVATFSELMASYTKY